MTTMMMMMMMRMMMMKMRMLMMHLMMVREVSSAMLDEKGGELSEEVQRRVRLV